MGEPAPELVLSDLKGEQVSLKEQWAERTVAIFWMEPRLWLLPPDAP